jgi:hypothetical protein
MIGCWASSVAGLVRKEQHMAIDRTAFNALVDDDGSGTTGSVWNKAAIDSVLLDPMDAALVGQATVSGTPAAQQLALFSDADTITGDAGVSCDVGSRASIVLSAVPAVAAKARLHADSGGNNAVLSFNQKYDGAAWVQDDATLAGSRFYLNQNGIYFDTTLGPFFQVSETGLAVLYGGQVRFPTTQNPSTDAYTFDDYRELNWTPELGGDGGQSGQSYSSRGGRAIKLGRLVAAWFDLTLSGKGTIGGSLQVTGLSLPGAEFLLCPSSIRFHNVATNWIQVHAIPLPGTTTFVLQGNQASGISSAIPLTAGDITNSTHFAGTIVYWASQ